MQLHIELFENKKTSLVGLVLCELAHGKRLRSVFAPGSAHGFGLEPNLPERG